MKVNQQQAFIVNITITFIITLMVTLALFISSPLWADENIHAQEKNSFDEKLAYADSIRSSKPKQFLVLVAELNEYADFKQYSDPISSTQQYNLDYLNLYLLMYQGNLVEAITASETLINSNANSLLKFRAKIGLVNIFAVNQNWAKGLTTLSSMLADKPLIKNEKLVQQALTVTSVFYNQLGQYNLGLSYAKKVESQSTLGRDLCFAKGEIIKSSFLLRKITPADPKIRQAISLCRINKEHLIISSINSYVARAYIENNQQDKAMDLLSSTLQDTLNTKYPRFIAEYYSLLAHAYWLNNNAALTKKFALKALEQDSKRTTTVAKVLSYKLLFEISQAEEDFETALHYHQQYTLADKVYYDENQAKHLAFQLAEHQAIEQQNQITLLNRKNDLLTAEQALTNANAENTRLIVIVLALTLAVLLFWGLRLLKAHKRIKELAEYDALTDIFNRGHFTQVANNALRYCQSAGQDLSIIMFDLDYFKKINDDYGHACGDWALQKTVEVCKNIGRQNDIFARLGGEEFCLLLTSCNSQAAQLRAEACRKAIAEINTQGCGHKFTITASFGITDVKTSGYELEKLLADSDSATYASKHSGRNQVTVFQVKPTKEATEEIATLDNSRTVF